MGTATDSDTPNRTLAEPLARLATVGSRTFLVAVGLVVLAFLTNPAPTQDLPGVGLPVTLPVTQPHIGHSAASYLVGMWLWEFTFPLALLAAYDRWTSTSTGARRLLVGLPAAYMLGLHLYCRFVYVPTVDPTPLGPAATAVCWAYCATGDPLWGGVTLTVAAVGLLAWAGAARGWQGRRRLAILFGVLSLPLGVPAIYWGYVTTREAPTPTGQPEKGAS